MAVMNRVDESLILIKPVKTDNFWKLITDKYHKK